jgi:hypothetical protein
MSYNTKRLRVRLTGALISALAISIFFVEVGYSGASTLSDFFREFVVALISYVSAALVVHRFLGNRDRFLGEMVLIAVGGSVLSFLVQVGVLEGQNGLIAYVNQARREVSWKPIGDLGIRVLFSSAITSVISLPFVALGLWLGAMRRSSIAKRFQ